MGTLRMWPCTGLLITAGFLLLSMPGDAWADYTMRLGDVYWATAITQDGVNWTHQEPDPDVDAFKASATAYEKRMQLEYPLGTIPPNARITEVTLGFRPTGLAGHETVLEFFGMGDDGTIVPAEATNTKQFLGRSPLITNLDTYYTMPLDAVLFDSIYRSGAAYMQMIGTQRTLDRLVELSGNNPDRMPTLTITMIIPEPAAAAGAGWLAAGLLCRRGRKSPA